MSDVEELDIIPTPNNNNEDDGDTDKKKKNHPIVAIKNTADYQRMKLQRLMANPEKPVIIPPSKSRDRGLPAPPEFVRNVMGSSAGAGSGEFHVYRHIRRKEYARQRAIAEKSRIEKLEQEFEQKREETKQLQEMKTAKKRAKRQRRKETLKNKKAKPRQESRKSESDSDSSSSNEEADKSNSGDAKASNNNGKSKSTPQNGSNGMTSTKSKLVVPTYSSAMFTSLPHVYENTSSDSD